MGLIDRRLQYLEEGVATLLMLLLTMTIAGQISFRYFF